MHKCSNSLFHSPSVLLSVFHLLFKSPEIMSHGEISKSKLIPDAQGQHQTKISQHISCIRINQLSMFIQHIFVDVSIAVVLVNIEDLL